MKRRGAGRVRKTLVEEPDTAGWCARAVASVHAYREYEGFTGTFPVQKQDVRTLAPIARSWNGCSDASRSRVTTTALHVHALYWIRPSTYGPSMGRASASSATVATSDRAASVRASAAIAAAPRCTNMATSSARSRRAGQYGGFGSLLRGFHSDPCAQLSCGYDEHGRPCRRSPRRTPRLAVRKHLS